MISSLDELFELAQTSIDESSADMLSSARLSLRDAREIRVHNRPEYVINRLVDSLDHSVGRSHRSYKTAVAYQVMLGIK